jgi:o-succinylbenzoate---CoA ligase
MTETRLPDWLHQRALVSPNRLALVAAGMPGGIRGGERLTFAELDARVSGTAGWLKRQGVSSGERVAVLMRNGLAFAVLVHAISRAGGVLVPINIRLTAGEVTWQLKDVKARLLIYDAATAELAKDATQDLPELQAVLEQEVTQAESLAPSYFDLSAPHSILYTSGTTGRPKGAVLTYGNHWWNAIGSVLNLGLEAEDRWLAILPLFHVGGMAILLRGAIYGNPVIVHEAFDPEAVNRVLDEEAITIVSMVATTLQRTLETRGERPFPKTLRCVLLGGGPAPRPLLEACAARGVPVVQTYGLTESSSQVATLAPEDALRKLGSAGKPLMSVELKIDGEGPTGEILVRGPTITAGYLDRAEANARAFRDGWFHTGDIGQMDEEGYLYVLDRRDDLIISGGENVYPAEVESVLRSHPAVADAGVVGRPHKDWGQSPVAFVVQRGTVSEAELKSFCEARLARYKIPSEIRFVAELPHNANGKLLRRALLSLE